SAKKEGWMACDFLSEYVVQEVKSMMPFNINEMTGDTLRKTYSPQIMVFRDTRKKMHQESEAPTFGYHSSPVKTHGDVERIVDKASSVKSESTDPLEMTLRDAIYISLAWRNLGQLREL